MERVLEGDLTSFEVPDLLTFLNIARRTGVLAMERKDQETRLFVREGKPVYATSTKEDLRLGRMLIRQEKLRPEVLEGVLEKRGKGGHRIGQVLVAERLLNETELASVLKVQVSEVIFDTFSWHEGHFAFWDRVDPPPTAVTLEMELQNLLMEGVRRIDSRGRLAEIFPELNNVVEAVANPERVKHSVTLTPEEWKVFFLVDGRRSLSEVCHLAGNTDEKATLQILYNLMVARFVILVPPSPVPETLPPMPLAQGPDPNRTHRLPAAVGAPAAVSVEFVPKLRGPSVAADTKEIVTPQAVQYMANVQKVTVSRLILVADGRETSFPLTGDTYTLGRHRNNDITISDPKVSSFHARIDRSPDGFVLVDLKSRNGTFLNGKRLEAGLLKTGDEVRLGTARLLYKVDYTSSILREKT